MPWGKLTLSFSIAVRDRMVPPPPPPHHLYAKANTSSSIFLHWRRPAFTTAQIINYTIRCNPVGLQNASLVLYLQTYVASINGCFLCSLPRSYFLHSWAGLSFSCEHLSQDLPYLLKCLGILHLYHIQVWNCIFWHLLPVNDFCLFVSPASCKKIRQEAIFPLLAYGERKACLRKNKRSSSCWHQKIKLFCFLGYR